MSAYMCDREHVVYLVQCALSLTDRHSKGIFRWYHGENIRELRHENMIEVGQMLWDENLRSINYRYPDTVKNPKDSPGKLSDAESGFELLEGDFGFRFRVYETSPINLSDPVPDLAQLFMSCDCYAYQACEHPEWKDSSAQAFINALRQAAWCRLPGYDSAEWGAPKRKAS